MYPITLKYGPIEHLREPEPHHPLQPPVGWFLLWDETDWVDWTGSPWNTGLHAGTPEKAQQWAAKLLADNVVDKRVWSWAELPDGYLALIETAEHSVRIETARGWDLYELSGGQRQYDAMIAEMDRGRGVWELQPRDDVGRRDPIVQARVARAIAARGVINMDHLVVWHRNEQDTMAADLMASAAVAR